MLSLLFMSIQTLPVLMKLLLNFSPPSTYERLAALRDDADLDVEELQQEARRTVEEANAGAGREGAGGPAEGRRPGPAPAAVASAVGAAVAGGAGGGSAGVRDTGRALWDTGPLRLARSATGRTVRLVRRRPGPRVSS
jgi:hypothetical protein